MRGRPSRRRAWVVAVCVLVTLVGGSVVTSIVSARPATQSGSSASHGDVSTGDVSTALITRGTLAGTTQVQGSLGYAGQRSISAGSSGTITWLPTLGSIIEMGGTLYSVDNRPVTVMSGTLPAWRSFESGMDDGPDVLQLETSLKALGFFTRQPDAEFAWSTSTAIRAWQKATGQPQSGVINLGSVVFASGALRVATVSQVVGDVVGPGTKILDVSSQSKTVTVNLKLGDQALGVVGNKVSIALPGGKKAEGTVVAVGVPTELEVNSQKRIVIPVSITLDDPALAGNIQQATVTAEFASESKENVLFVPVEALLALDRSTFGVEVVHANGTTERVKVTTGLFAAGSVEISGKGIKEGMRVMVPKI